MKSLCLMALVGMLFASCGGDGKYTITVKSNNDQWGKAYGSGNYEKGATVTIYGTPEVNYQFDKWSDGNTENPRTITVNGDATYVANFKTIDNQGGGGGNQGGDTPQPPQGGFEASFVFEGTTYTGIAAIAGSVPDNNLLTQVMIITDEQYSEPILFVNMLMREGDQTQQADGCNICLMLDGEDQVVVGANNFAHYQTVQECTIKVSALDLTNSLHHGRCPPVLSLIIVC